jgi:hypothetical protein
LAPDFSLLKAGQRIAEFWLTFEAITSSGKMT